MYTHIDGAHARVPVGSFKIGRIARNRKPLLTNRVVGDPEVSDQEWARREGMVAFAGYPLVVREQLLGVMAMFSRKELSDTTLHAMATVADSILDKIEIAARRALTLAVNFVDATRIESGAFELHREYSSLNEIVEHVVAQEQTLARHQKITIDLDLSRDVPDLRVDERAFERVVTNLLGNAVKFSSAGGRIRIATARRGNEVVLSISDRGPGIPPEERGKLFKRYSQAASAARKDGSGLGLFIVKMITEAHGGRVSVECPSDGGSVFKVILPAGTVEALSRAEAASG
jgi:signal transduction histidine kinase